MFAKIYLRKFGAAMTNTTTEKLGAKRSPNLPALAPWHPPEGESGETAKEQNVWTHVEEYSDFEKKRRWTTGWRRAIRI